MTESVLLIEPFFGGSHKQLIDLLSDSVDGCHTVTLPAKKWPWRARTSALYFSQVIATQKSFRVLFCSTLNLSELTALRPDLAKLWKIIYFHENQLQYPVRKQKDRDFQFGYNQILSCLVADEVIFNSTFNRDSFLSSISTFLKLIPSYRPKDVEQLISPKCRVMYFPLDMKLLATEKEKILEQSSVSLKEPHEEALGPTSICIVHSDSCTEDGVDSVLHIVWPHRWEHDKDPETFFRVLFRLQDTGCKFKVSVLGESYSELPAIFDEAKTRLTTEIVHWGYRESRRDYYAILCQADVVVSTALHEFFGVAMIEAAFFGCYPLCPNRLVYPEIFPDECLYNTEVQLFKRLRDFTKCPLAARRNAKALDLRLERFSWETLKLNYTELLRATRDVDEQPTS